MSDSPSQVKDAWRNIEKASFITASFVNLLRKTHVIHLEPIERLTIFPRDSPNGPAITIDLKPGTQNVQIGGSFPNDWPDARSRAWFDAQFALFVRLLQGTGVNCGNEPLAFLYKILNIVIVSFQQSALKAAATEKKEADAAAATLSEIKEK